MSSIKVHAGDFLKQSGNYNFNTLTLKTEEHPYIGESIDVSQIETLDVATEENVKKLGGAVGWGAAGGLLLGSVGLLAGLLAGGNKKNVTFVAKFYDGRKLLATTDSKTFTKIQASLF
ncbi:hypothetical protein [Marinobacter shengliensis]|uniref:hypothetical protein n=1 Tax=Marinobacter shengliensis TaxID=1389223 RepID=UPI0025733C7B|nr:hypothetical protein [Marinobacter shengliensis]BEH14276.1 hypothetical protein MAALD49_16440 [Marinobacter shengliensis]